MGVFLAPFDSAWVEEVRPAAHALLAESVIDMGTGGGAPDLQRLRRLHHLLPDDARVLAALVAALHEAGAGAEAQATQAAYQAAVQALGG